MVAALRDRAWSLLQRRAHTDGSGRRMIQAAGQEDQAVFEAGQADIPLRDRDPISISPKGFMAAFISYESLHQFTVARVHLRPLLHQLCVDDTFDSSISYFIHITVCLLNYELK